MPTLDETLAAVTPFVPKLPARVAQAREAQAVAKREAHLAQMRQDALSAIDDFEADADGTSELPAGQRSQIAADLRDAMSEES